MAKTLATLTSAGWTTKGSPLTAEEVDDNFIALELDAEAIELPVGVAVLHPVDRELPSKWLPLAGQELAEAEYTTLATFYSPVGGLFTIQDLSGISPDPEYHWCIKAK